MTQDVDLLSANIIGKNSNAIKFEFKKDGHKVQGIGFGPIIEKYTEDMENVDIVYNINLNSWKDQYSVQLQIIDIRKNEIYENIKKQNKNVFDILIDSTNNVISDANKLSLQEKLGANSEW